MRAIKLENGRFALTEKMRLIDEAKLIADVLLMTNCKVAKEELCFWLHDVLAQMQQEKVDG